MATYEEFSVDQGADIAIELQLENPDGSPKDLRNHTATAKLKKSYKSADSVSFACTMSGDGTNGILLMALTNEQTDSLKPGRYVYDLELSYVDETSGRRIVDRILEGRIQVSPSVTR